MTLYTEEQVNELHRALRDIVQWDDDLEYDWEDAGYRAMDALRCFEKITPIQLPSDEQIDDFADDNTTTLELYVGFKSGAKWMRDKIKGGEQ